MQSWMQAKTTLERKDAVKSKVAQSASLTPNDPKHTSNASSIKELLSLVPLKPS